MKLLKTESGLAMPLVMIVLVILSLLGIALWNYSISELNHSVRNEKSARAYYVARAGAESMARHIMVNPELMEQIPEVNDVITSESINFDIADYDNELAEDLHVGELFVTMEKIEENRVKITGTGTVDDVSRQVSLILETQEPFDGVVYSLGSMDFHQHVTIEGDIVCGGKVNPPDNYTGNIKEDTTIVFPPPDPDFPPVPQYSGNYTLREATETITESPDGAYKKITISNNETLIIDAIAASGPLYIETEIFEMNNDSAMELKADPDKPIVIVVDKMSLKEVTITGSGTVYFYVRSELDVQTKHAAIDNNAYLVVYLDQGANMDMQANDAYFEGLVYGPEATVSIGGNADFSGAMIVENLKGTGNSSIGSAKTKILRKYSWDVLDLDYGGYWMVHWIR